VLLEAFAASSTRINPMPPRTNQIKLYAYEALIGPWLAFFDRPQKLLEVSGSSVMKFGMCNRNSDLEYTALSVLDSSHNKRIGEQPLRPLLAHTLTNTIRNGASCRKPLLAAGTGEVFS
jgi:hypothetical protein